MNETPRKVKLGPAVAGMLAKTGEAHKYDYGHALVMAGGPARGGAARLAARAALRVGAGLVTLGCPPAALAENAARLDAVMLRPVADGAALAALLEDRRFNALCLGPALGTDAHARALVVSALHAGRATLLDADALTAFEDDPQWLFETLHPLCLLTPHEGEFGRLFPDLAGDLGEAEGRSGAVAAAAARAGCPVLLKGARTVIAGPDGELALQDATGAEAAPWLATAGSGDVMAGIAAGLMARGFAAMAAGETAAALHVAAARAFGPGLIAEDLPDMLPQVFRELGL
jgi:hydroxyethylthiazole kinase-like uncharacterized protein yjeF